MNHEVTHMKKFENQLFVVTNFNELSIVNIESKVIERSVLFQDVNMTAIHVTEDLFIFGDHSSYIYTVKKSDFEVRPIGVRTIPERRHGEEQACWPHKLDFEYRQ